MVGATSTSVATSTAARDSDGFRAVPGSRANFFLTEILDPELDSTRVFKELLARGVIVKDGSDIEGLGQRYLRVDVNLRKHMDRFLWALADIRTY